MLENAELIKQYAKHISEPWLLYEIKVKGSKGDWG